MLSIRVLSVHRSAYACKSRTTRRTPILIQAELGNSPSTQGKSSAVGDGKQPVTADQLKTTAYYAGLLNNDIRQDNRATSSDMLVRNLQLAGGVAGLLGLLVLLFLASNGLLTPPQSPQ